MSKIAILATGDELVNGDILNTNGQEIAQKLVECGLSVGCQVVIADAQECLECSLNFLTSDFDTIIVTGGLGPTSDDRTRFAASAVIGQALIFDDKSWQKIVDRLKTFSLEPHEANRQQALFPENAHIIPNERGTAAGFCLEYNHSRLFFLPGPPNECIPMFDQYVLPQLTEQKSAGKLIHKRWRLFGVSEGEIAASLDEALKPYPLETAYRIDFPYLEFKIRTIEHSVLDSLIPMIEDLVKPHILSHAHIPASEFLRDRIQQIKGQLVIDDRATGGLLQTKLLSPQTQDYLKFTSISNDNTPPLALMIQGLDELWSNKSEPGETQLQLTFIIEGTSHQYTFQLPYRQNYIRAYAVEFISHQINQFLNEIVTT